MSEGKPNGIKAVRTFDGYVTREDYPEKKKKKEAKPLSEVLKAFSKEKGLTRRTKLQNISAVWNEAAGAQYAQHSRVAELKSGVLYVHVDSAACLHEMEAYEKANILSALREHLGKEAVHEIKFSIKGAG